MHLKSATNYRHVCPIRVVREKSALFDKTLLQRGRYDHKILRMSKPQLMYKKRREIKF